MPSVGKRETRTMGNITKDPMYAYAKQFCEVEQNILSESKIDYGMEPVRALSYPNTIDALREFFVNDSVIGAQTKDGREYQINAEQYQDERDMMTEAFANDVGAIRESAIAGLNTFNPMVGLSLPMHKYLMLNCVFAQAIPRFVAKSPMWTESIESRYMVHPDGTKIDLALQQNQIYRMWQSIQKPAEVPIKISEYRTVDILNDYFNADRVNDNLGVDTHIDAVLVQAWAEVGDMVVTMSNNTNTTVTNPTVFTETAATTAGMAYKWFPWDAHFTPGYGDAKRVLVSPVTITVPTSATATATVNDTIFAVQADNLFEINCAAGNVAAVRMHSVIDPSKRNHETPRVEWGEKTIFMQIPAQKGISINVTPEEVKDIGSLYGINQVTKYMSMIRIVLENVKDDDIRNFLDDSFENLDDDHRIYKTIDFAPRQGYHDTHIRWLQETFMSTLDHFVSGLITILRDPNMQINVIGRPEIIRTITPIEYNYSTADSVGPIELDFKKTVVTSDKRVYNFISAQKMYGLDYLYVLLTPKNTNRIIYRLYDYQMYISNEIRTASDPQLPALTAFQRYLTTSLQPVQGRLYVSSPTGLTDFKPTPIANVMGQRPDGITEYANNDLSSVYTAWDSSVNRNV